MELPRGKLSPKPGDQAWAVGIWRIQGGRGCDRVEHWVGEGRRLKADKLPFPDLFTVANSLRWELWRIAGGT